MIKTGSSSKWVGALVKLTSSVKDNDNVKDKDNGILLLVMAKEKTKRSAPLPGSPVTLQEKRNTKSLRCFAATQRNFYK